ncbi:MAG: hypothetical protein JO369_01355 [Paucibacter sp.]|nr:hypothetical protein [Roseateles sp.]
MAADDESALCAACRSSWALIHASSCCALRHRHQVGGQLDARADGAERRHELRQELRPALRDLRGDLEDHAIAQQVGDQVVDVGRLGAGALGVAERLEVELGLRQQRARLLVGVLGVLALALFFQCGGGLLDLLGVGLLLAGLERLDHGRQRLGDGRRLIALGLARLRRTAAAVVLGAAAVVAVVAAISPVVARRRGDVDGRLDAAADLADELLQRAFAVTLLVKLLDLLGRDHLVDAELDAVADLLEQRIAAAGERLVQAAAEHADGAHHVARVLGQHLHGLGRRHRALVGADHGLGQVVGHARETQHLAEVVADVGDGRVEGREQLALPGIDRHLVGHGRAGGAEVDGRVERIERDLQARQVGEHFLGDGAERLDDTGEVALAHGLGEIAAGQAGHAQRRGRDLGGRLQPVGRGSAGLAGRERQRFRHEVAHDVERVGQRAVAVAVLRQRLAHHHGRAADRERGRDRLADAFAREPADDQRGQLARDVDGARGRAGVVAFLGLLVDLVRGLEHAAHGVEDVGGQLDLVAARREGAEHVGGHAREILAGAEQLADEVGLGRELAGDLLLLAHLQVELVGGVEHLLRLGILVEHEAVRVDALEPQRRPVLGLHLGRREQRPGLAAVLEELLGKPRAERVEVTHHQRDLRADVAGQQVVDGELLLAAGEHAQRIRVDLVDLLALDLQKALALERAGLDLGRQQLLRARLDGFQVGADLGQQQRLLLALPLVERVLRLGGGAAVLQRLGALRVGLALGQRQAGELFEPGDFSAHGVSAS